VQRRWKAGAAQRRCFGYVGDVVEALVRIARSPSVAGEVLNIGNDEEVSIRELAETIRTKTASHSEIVHVLYDQAHGPGFEDMFRRVPCLEKIERLLGYRPSTPLPVILRFRRGRYPSEDRRKRPQYRSDRLDQARMRTTLRYREFPWLPTLRRTSCSSVRSTGPARPFGPSRRRCDTVCPPREGARKPRDRASL
jgi:hypothetical protein